MWPWRETIPPPNPELRGKYWLRARSGWITPSCPDKVFPSTQWANKPTLHSPKYQTGVGAHGDQRTWTQTERQSTSVWAGLTCLFALRVGKSLLHLVIQEDTWWEGWIGGGMRNSEPPSVVLLFLSQATPLKFSDCCSTAADGVVSSTS